MIELSYALAAARPARAELRHPLLDLLQAVHEQGSISAAARAVDRSYRHVWGELRRYELALDRTLIVWDKGQRARLSEVGERLLLLERQTQARLAPQIDALQAGLERAFALALDAGAPLLRLHAASDDALGVLRSHAAARALHLEIHHADSVAALRDLHEGRCLLAGFHAPEGAAAQGAHAALRQAYLAYLRPAHQRLIGFARRSQGLFVARGNPLGLRSLADAARPGVRYVNRGPHSGTRVLLDALLLQHGLAARDLHGYDREEPTHAAVAQAVASGQADAGLGPASAALGRGVDFVPLAQERYHLVVARSALARPEVHALLAVLQTDAWCRLLAGLPGHAPADSGQVLPLQRLLPWCKAERRAA